MYRYVMVSRLGIRSRCHLLLIVLHLWRRSDDDEQLVLAGGEVGQDVVVDALGVGDGMVLRPAVLTLQEVVAGSGRSSGFPSRYELG